MRGAGCTWNDITDRDFDGQVERTKSRPIPSGQVSVRGAVIWMLIQALLAFAILLTFYTNAIILGAVALLPVLIYTTPLYATLYGAILFDEIPDLLSSIGGILIVAGALILGWRERLAASRKR